MKARTFIAAAALLLAACSAAPDEAWFRIVEIRAVGVDRVGETGSITVYESDLRDNSTDLVDVAVENYTSIVGSSGDSGVGVAVTRAVVTYTYGGYDLPSYQYPLTLYLPPPPGGEGPSSGVVSGLPVATATLKGWILDPGNIPPDLLRQPLTVQATITLFAKTDEGRELETSASLSLTFI